MRNLRRFFCLPLNTRLSWSWLRIWPSAILSRKTGCPSGISLTPGWSSSSRCRKGRSLPSGKAPRPGHHGLRGLPWRFHILRFTQGCPAWCSQGRQGTSCRRGKCFCKLSSAGRCNLRISCSFLLISGSLALLLCKYITLLGQNSKSYSIHIMHNFSEGKVVISFIND